MADTVTLPGTGAVILTDEVTDGTLGTGQVQHIKIMDGAVNSTNKMSVDTSGRISALIQGAQASLQTGSITTSTSTVTVSDATGYNLATVGVVGTYAGISAVFEASPDGTNWFTLQGQRTDNGVAETGFTTLTNTTRAWDVPIGGWFQFRIGNRQG